MILFLDRPRTASSAINENYARELMELFTLGADRGAYTEDDVRELARSLTGWRLRLERRARRPQLPLGRAGPLGPGLQDRVRPDAARWTWEDACALVVEHPQHPSFFVAKLWSYFIPTAPRRRRPRPSSRRSTRARATRSAPCSRRSCARRSSTRGRGWSSRRSSRRRHAARAQARRSPTNAWAGCCRRRRPARSTTRPTSRAGTTSAGWTPTRCSRAGSGRRLRARRATPRRRAPDDLPGRDARRRRVAEARAFWGDPTLDRRRPCAALDSRSRSTPRSPSTARAAGCARSARTRCASSSPAPPTTRPAEPCHLHCAAARLLPLELLRDARQAGRGLRGDRARHAAARRHRPRRALVPRPRQRARAGRVRRLALVAHGVRGGHRRRRRRPARSACSSRSSAPAALDSLSLLAPVGDPRYAQLRRDLALTPSGNAADVFAEDTRLHWHPSAAPLRDLHRAGKVSRDPGDRLRRPQPVALHLAPLLGGRRGRPVRPRRLARPLPRPPRRRRQPAAGPLARLHARARRWPPANVPVAAVSQPGVLLAWTPRRLGRRHPHGADRRAAARQGALATDDPELARPAARAARASALRAQLAGLQGTDAPWQAAVAYPTRGRASRERLAVLAEMLGAACRCGSSRSTPTAATTRTRTRRDAAGQPRRCSRQSLAAFQADLEARGLADRVLVHVWSEFGRRPEANGAAPTTARRRLAWSSARRRAGTMVGEFPGLADARRATTTSATPSTSAPSTARCSSSGSASTRPGSSPSASSSRAPRWCDEALGWSC